MTDEMSADSFENNPIKLGNDSSPVVSGLTSEEVAERIARGQVNVNTDLKTKSIKELCIENTCTLFNLINLIFAVLVLLTGAFKNLTFLGIVFANTAIGIIQAVRSKRMVDKLTLLASKQATVLRDGVEQTLELDQIVLDDVVRLGRGDQIPADSVVLTGEAQVNESLLTGESDLIRKRVGADLMSGSFIDSGTVYARVVHVGADNYVSKINNEAKYVKKVNSEIMGALNAIVRFASVIMLPLGIALFCSSIHQSFLSSGQTGSVFSWLFGSTEAWPAVSSAILTTVGALLGMIPQGLVLLTSSVLAIATIRLARRRVLAQQLYCIETLARVDVLCLDKTGTITSGRMRVDATYPLVEERGSFSDGTDASSLDFALANIARATSGDANETCRALLDYYGSRTVEMADPTFVVPFSSSKKWSGAQFDRGAFVMGAAQFVLSADDFSHLEARVSALADTARVLVVCAVDGFSSEGEILGRPRPIGLVTIQDEIRSSAGETIRYFCDQGVTLNVISGDDPRTVASIARVVGIPGADAYIDATKLDTPAKVEAAASRYHVFGRVTPQQKRELVDALKRRGHTVAMTGDGVNDVLALKEADCSIAMAAGSEAARNVAELVLIDNDFSSMPAVVAEGRRSINNLQRSASLFLTKTLFSMGLAALCIACPPYPFEPITMTLINFFCIGFPSFVLALEPNNSRISGAFLANVLRRSLPAALAVILSSALSIAAASVFGLGEAELSTLCLVSTCAIGAALIWRISWPFTPLRAAVFGFVIVGLLVCVVFFPGLFSIAPLSLPITLVLLVIIALASFVYFQISRFFERDSVRATKLASGFGRGVRVSFGRGGSDRVSAGESHLERISRRLTDSKAERRDRTALHRAERHAQTALAPSKGVRGRLRVERSQNGVRVMMPSSRRVSRKGGSDAVSFRLPRRSSGQDPSDQDRAGRA